MSCGITITDESGIAIIEVGTQGPSGPPGSGGLWSATDPTTGYELGDAVTWPKGGIYYIWISAQAGNLNHDPATDDGTWWLRGPILDAVAIQFDVSADAPAHTPGLFKYSGAAKVPSFDTEFGGVSGQLFTEIWVPLVVNKTGAQLNNGEAVLITGAQGQRPVVSKADASDPTLDLQVVVMTQDLANNATGFATAFGLVRGIDTTGTPQGEVWADGDLIYLSATTPGALTKISPSSPYHSVIIGRVIDSNVDGEMYVSPHHDPHQFLLKIGGTLTGPIENVTTVASAATMTLNMGAGPHHVMDTQDENTTLAISNAGTGRRATASLKQGAGGGFTISVPGTWIPFVTPTPTTTAGEWNIVEVWQLGTDVFYILKAQA